MLSVWEKWLGKWVLDCFKYVLVERWNGIEFKFKLIFGDDIKVEVVGFDLSYLSEEVECVEKIVR